MFHELQSKLEVDTPLGKGVAFLIQSGDNDYYWTCVLKETRAIVTFKQQEILVTRHFTFKWGFTNDDMRQILDRYKPKPK